MNTLGVKPSYATGFAQWPGQSEYPQLWTGLVGAWAPFLGVTGGQVFDLSGNGYAMDFVNSPVWSPGNFGQSILFDDGLSQYLSYGAPIITGYPSTLIIWFNQDDDTIDCHLIGFADEATEATYHRIVAVGDSDGTGRLFGQINDGAGGFGSAIASASWNINTWHQACFVALSEINRKIYLDGGNEVTNTVDVTFPAVFDNTTIGRLSRLTPTNYMSGKIGLAMIYNRALSAGEVALHYQIMKRYAA